MAFHSPTQNRAQAAHPKNQGILNEVNALISTGDSPPGVEIALQDVAASLRRFPAAVRHKSHLDLLIGAADLPVSIKTQILATLPSAPKRSRPSAQTQVAPKRQAEAGDMACSRAPQQALADVRPAGGSGGASQRPPLHPMFQDAVAGIKRVGSQAGCGVVVDDSWEVVLLLDTREVRTRSDRDYIASHLMASGVKVETRMLPLGDMVWVARPSVVPGLRRKGGDAASVSSQRSAASAKAAWAHEWLMDVIIERKRLSDLSSSIQDGRYEDQKRRLSECPCSRVLYLLEGELQRRDILTKTGLETARCSTTVRSGFAVHKSASVDASIALLADTHRALTRAFLPSPGTSRPLLACPCLPKTTVTYATFSEQCSKPSTQAAVSLFGMQLRQVNGMSGPRAQAVLEAYPTPSHLRKAYAAVNEAAGAALLKDLGVPGQRGRLGPTLSRRLHALYTARDYADVL